MHFLTGKDYAKTTLVSQDFRELTKLSSDDDKYKLFRKLTGITNLPKEEFLNLEKQMRKTVENYHDEEIERKKKKHRDLLVSNSYKEIISLVKNEENGIVNTGLLIMTGVNFSTGEWMEVVRRGPEQAKLVLAQKDIVDQILKEGRLGARLDDYKGSVAEVILDTLGERLKNGNETEKELYNFFQYLASERKQKLWP